MPNASDGSELLTIANTEELGSVCSHLIRLSKSVSTTVLGVMNNFLGI